MPNGRSGGYLIHTKALIAALKLLDADAIVGPNIKTPVTVAEMLVVAEYTALTGLQVEEQYRAWFIVRLPDFWVTVKEESPLFAGLTQAIKQFEEECESPPEIHERPIENCYWVAPTKLLAGEFPGALEQSAAIKKITALTDAGVAAFIDLTEERDGLAPYEKLLESASYQRFGIRDVSTPDSSELTLAILNAIDDHIAAGHLVYVHCWGGVGRTGVIVGCWLARHGFTRDLPGSGQMKYGAAVERLAELWKQCPKSASRKSPETSKQRYYIQEWNEEPKSWRRAEG